MNINENILKFNEQVIYIKISDLEIYDLEKLKKIREMISETLAYSIHYYEKSKYWKKVYWFLSLLSILLTSTSAVLNTIVDRDNNEFIKEYNIIFGFLITIGLGIISILNPAEKKRDFELAGDKYKEISEDLFNETFYNENDIIDLNLSHIIQIYMVKINNSREQFTEPSISKISSIKSSNTFNKLSHFNRLILT